MRIELHIERLSLDGLPYEPRQSSAIQQALVVELSRLLVSEGLHPALERGTAVPSLSGGLVRLDPGLTPAQLGVGVARAVYSTLGVEQPR